MVSIASAKNKLRSKPQQALDGIQHKKTVLEQKGLLQVTRNDCYLIK